jgi:fucose permease
MLPLLVGILIDMRDEWELTNIGYIFVIGQIGAAAFPFITGVAANKHGPQVLQPIATALLVAAGVVWCLIPRKEVEHEGAE